MLVCTINASLHLMLLEPKRIVGILALILVLLVIDLTIIIIIILHVFIVLMVMLLFMMPTSVQPLLLVHLLLG